MKRTFRKQALTVVSAGFCLFGCFLTNTHASTSTAPTGHGAGESSWFVGVGLGGSSLSLPGRTSVANGAPSPNDHDTFTIKNASADITQLSAGYRFYQYRKYFPYNHLYLQYRHYISSKIRGTIDQYDLPGFKNYSYKVSYAADLFTLTDKFTLFNEKGWMPYFAVGAGVILNHLYNYNEYPLGVTPRTSPNYGGQVTRKLALTLGIGLDYMLTENTWATLGYDHIFQGNIKTGPGTGDWINTNLDIGNVKMDTVFINITANVPDAFKFGG